MIPNWSDKHPSKRAQKIYTEALGRYAIWKVASFVLVYFALLALTDWLDWSFDLLNPVLLAPFYVVIAMEAPTRGVRALKRAGLYREETAIIERTATTFAGAPLEVRESTFAVRLGFAGFFLLMGAGCYWLRQSQPFNAIYFWSGGAGIILFVLMALQTLRYARKPELRLDKRGITSCQGWMSSRLVRWESIAYLERKRIWGLPPLYDLDGAPSETISLHDAKGNALIILRAGAVAATTGGAILSVWTDELRKPVAKSAKSPTQNQLFVAEIERRLTAATPPVSEENRDE